MPNDQQYNETALLHRIADGDEEAFAAFFRLYFNQLYLIMVKYTQKHIEAEDIVQAVFVKAWEKKEVFKTMERPLNWFFITARNEYLDRFRKNRRSRQYLQYLQESFKVNTLSPESIFSSKEFTSLYYQAIKNLPEKQRVAYTLSREMGLTYAEIAAQMNIGTATVKEHIIRANNAIRSFLLHQAGGKNELIILIFLLTSCPPF